LVLHYLNDILCKNYNYVFVFAKVIPKTLLVPFFSGHGVVKFTFNRTSYICHLLGLLVHELVTRFSSFASSKILEPSAFLASYQ